MIYILQYEGPEGLELIVSTRKDRILESKKEIKQFEKSLEGEDINIKLKKVKSDIILIDSEMNVITQ